MGMLPVLLISLSFPLMYIYYNLFVYTGRLHDIPAHQDTGQDNQYLQLKQEFDRLQKEVQTRKKNNAANNETDTANINIDWFDKDVWESHQDITWTCPYFEDICIYNEQFWVKNERELFHIPSSYWKHELFGGGQVPNSKISIDRYLKHFHASVWPSSMDKSAMCDYEPVVNNFILYSFYSHMAAEYHHRVTRHLYYMINENGLIAKDSKFYLFLADKVHLFATHHMLIEPWTQYQLQLFSSMFEQSGCKCYKRLFFCGTHYNQTSQILNPKQQLTTNYAYSRKYIDLYPKLIDFYNEWVHETNVFLKADIRNWKSNQLTSSQLLRDASNLTEINQWKFIGFYQRSGRRRWLNLEDMILNCNTAYNKAHIFCFEISFDDPERIVHSHEIILIHQSTDLLIGVHGSHFANAVMAKNDGTTALVELMMPNSRRQAEQTKKATALGVIFRYSKLSHMGMYIGNQTQYIKGGKFKKTKVWWNQDFMTDWTRISGLIEYVMVEEGGYCSKFQSNRQILDNIPKYLQGYTFVFYNMFCPNHRNASVWHVPYKYGSV